MLPILTLLLPLSCTQTLSQPVGLAMVQPPPAGPSAASISTGLEDLKLNASDEVTYYYFGYPVSGAGDINADGYGDMIAGANLGGDFAGEVYAYLGSAAGLDPSTEQGITASDGEAYEYYGWAAAGVGDLDGDGYDDVLVGASEDDDNGYRSGSAYVYYGSAAGLDTDRELKILPSDGQSQDYFAEKVAGAGDVNGDGFDDVILTAKNANDNSGAVYIYLGSSAGLDLSTELKISSAEVDHLFGSSARGVGDVNGDGYDDVAVGATFDDGGALNAGAVFVYFGSSLGIQAESVQKLVASDAQEGDNYGISISTRGDVNGDGFDDLAVGASGVDDIGDLAGAAYVYLGSADGIDEGSELKLVASDGTESAFLGYDLASAGDVDGDGYSDIIVGAMYTDWKGAAYVWHGSATGIVVDSYDKLVASDGADYDSFAYSVSGGVDINADGYDDVIVGAPSDDDFDTQSGSVYIFEGSCTDGDADGVCQADDCDDADDSIYPGATEIPDDGIDQDCDGSDATGDTGGGTVGGETLDGGTADGGAADGGTVDSGNGAADDTGTKDTGTGGSGSGCACSSGSGKPALSAFGLGLFGLLGLLRRKERSTGG